MDITLQPVSGAVQFHASPIAKDSTDTDPTPTAPQVPATAAPAVDTVSISIPAAVQNTAERQAVLSFKNVYAVSDKSFTIFKDATGKYITRYVSLRDGSVSYEPAAPTLVRQDPAVPYGPKIAISA